MDHRDKLVILHLNKKDMECSCFFTRDRNSKTRGFCNTIKKVVWGKKCVLIMEFPVLFFSQRQSFLGIVLSSLFLSTVSVTATFCHLAILKL